MPKRLAIGFFLAVGALVGWVIMFMAGTDVWHDTGRLDLWNLQGSPYQDLRAFVVTFYALLPILLAQVVLALANVMRRH